MSSATFSLGLTMNDQNSSPCDKIEGYDRTNIKDEKADRALLKQKGLLLFTALYILVFSGAPYGWGPMQIMLRDDGAFQHLCQENGKRNGTNAASFSKAEEKSDLFCTEQISSILNIPFYSFFTSTLLPVFGYVADIWGSIAVMRLASFLAVTGVGTLVLSRTVFKFDHLLYVAFLLIYMMTFASSIMIVQTGMVFDNYSTNNSDIENDSLMEADADVQLKNCKNDIDHKVKPRQNDSKRTQVISFLNALFDAGSITYLLLWKIKKSLGVEFSTMLIGYFLFAIFCFGGALFFWTILKKHISKQKKHPNIIENNESEHHGENITVDNIENVNGRGIEHFKIQAGEHVVEKEQHYVLIANCSPLDQLWSTQFVMITMFFCLHMMRNIFVLTSAENFLRHLGDANSRYITIFTCLLPVSVVAVPFVGYCFHRFGYYTMFQLANLLALLHGVIQVSFRSLNVQVAGFVVFSFYHCFFFPLLVRTCPCFWARTYLGKATD